MHESPSIASTLLGIVPGPGLLFGLLLLAAILGGYLARFVRVPRVIGYLLAGIGLHALLYGIIDPAVGSPEAQALKAAAKPLQAIKDLALGLILFAIGGVFERSRLRAVLPSVARIGLLEMGGVTVLLFLGCGAVCLLTLGEYAVGDRIVLALLLAVAGIATAPAATLFVLQEYEAKGPTTDTILGVTAANNTVCIVLFYSAFLILASLGMIDTHGQISEHLWLGLACTIIGSVIVGIICGSLISMLHAALPAAETFLIFFAVFILLGAGEKWLLAHVGPSYNFLLTSLVIGAVFANVAVDSEKLAIALRTVAYPIFVGFFVMAGYELHLPDLWSMGWLGGAYVGCRLVGKIFGARLGVRWLGQNARVGDRLGSALLCQAAVVIGLASYVASCWNHPLAGQFATVVLGSVVVFEMIGPLLVKRCVVLGGEVKAITLLRRSGPATEGVSVTRLTTRALLRLFGLGTAKKVAHHETVRVEHIMRTSVQIIPISATLDEVLHFVEHSTYSHFPVADERGGLAGVIHFSDVRDVIYDPTLCDLVTAVDLADPDSASVPIDLPLTELLALFAEQNVGVLPVVDGTPERRVIGVVEQRDLLRTLHQSNAGGAP